ncbi:SDR family oxidoreductase [Sphingosinicella sp. YJ22]|uniref:SDR family oxidoreductase n=1 Tax=Sphingosinicella sp. YJ22 TaxID=1104780 RepID=UPI00140B0EF7|nr:SDR family oxidoreductase [Sphingosinicella sp. YJ22]
MRVLVLGATGLIGSAVTARLVAAGHEVVGLTRARDAAARRLPVARWIVADLRDVRGPEDWLPHLEGIEAVVNCAGTLQDSLRDSTAKVHRDAPAALWRACERAGVRRVIQLSAIGVDRGGITDFSRSKMDGDEALEATSLDWVILRPSVVVGRQAYGGSALFRALASLPALPRIADAGPLDVVQLDDVAETVARLKPGAASWVALELAGPQRLSFDEVVAAYRSWLGWRPARRIRVPGVLMSLMWRLGDLVAWFGWRPPVRSTARRELVRGAVGDNSAWRAAIGIQPTPLAAALAAEPASVQERWFARLYLLKPVAFAIFILFWLATGLITLGPGYRAALGVMEASAAPSTAELAVIAGGFADIAVAGLILFRRTAKAGLLAALAVTISYLVAGTLVRPDLWLDPLGPLMKVWPILALNLILLAILDER